MQKFFLACKFFFYSSKSFYSHAKLFLSHAKVFSHAKLFFFSHAKKFSHAEIFLGRANFRLLKIVVPKKRKGRGYDY
jgi:hypothetical protein